ncbi:MAG: ROK family protein [Pseudomonadota bacterium]
MIAAADMGGSSWKLALMRDGVSLALEEVSRASGDARHQRLRSMFESMCAKHGYDFGAVEGIGISIAELVDLQRNRLNSPVNSYQAMADIGFDELAFRPDMPVVAQNDAKCALEGELAHGVLHDFADDPCLLIIYGSGIGVAFSVNGRIYDGANYAGGTFGGHLTVDMNGPLCMCGNRGCAEAMASGWVMEKRLRERAGFEASAVAKADKLDFEAVTNAARAGDQFALDALDHFIDVWAAHFGTLVHMLNPKAVALSGGFMRSSDLIVGPMLERTRARLWEPAYMPTVRLADDPMLSTLRGCEVIARRAIAKRGEAA